MATTDADPARRVRAVAPLKRSEAGGSGSFLVLADDGRQYWCKVLNNTQNSPLVPVNEQIVGWLGQLLGVAVCQPRLVEIPTDLIGWEFRTGYGLEGGWAHGGLAVDGAIETHGLDHRASADNSARHAGFFALYDWLGGQDPQWLYSTTASNEYFSHDHGHYLWGPNWTPASLAAQVGTPAVLGETWTGLSGDEIQRLVDRLQGLTREEISAALPNFPSDWPIGTVEVDAVVDLAFERRSDVATRLLALPI